jgi:hypothetical protein
MYLIRREMRQSEVALVWAERLVRMAKSCSDTLLVV